MNHVAAAERKALLDAALAVTVLAEDGSVVDFQQTTDEFAKAYGISLARARGAVSKAARIKRGETVKTRPGREPMGDGMTAITVYMSAAQIEQARTLGAGNVSAGVRLALKRTEMKTIDDVRIDVAATMPEFRVDYAYALYPSMEIKFHQIGISGFREWEAKAEDNGAVVYRRYGVGRNHPCWVEAYREERLAERVLDVLHREAETAVKAALEKA